MVSQGYIWKDIASRLPGRLSDSIRERYVNHLDPTLKKTPWTKEEDNILFENQRKLGNKWSVISKSLPGRSVNSIKNRYYNKKCTFLRMMRNHKEKPDGRPRKNRVKASSKVMKERSVGNPNFTERRTAPSSEDFPYSVVGV
jgi:hypothetical protein